MYEEEGDRRTICLLAFKSRSMLLFHFFVSLTEVNNLLQVLSKRETRCSVVVFTHDLVMEDENIGIFPLCRHMRHSSSSKLAVIPGSGKVDGTPLITAFA